MTIVGTGTDPDHLGIEAATGVTHRRATATGVSHATDGTRGAPDGTVGLGVLFLDVMAIETGIGTAESETVRQSDFFLSSWLIVLTKYGMYR